MTPANSKTPWVAASVVGVVAIGILVSSTYRPAEDLPQATVPPRPEAKVEFQPETKGEIQPETKAEVQPEIKIESRPEPEPGIKRPSVWISDQAPPPRRTDARCGTAQGFNRLQERSSLEHVRKVMGCDGRLLLDQDYGRGDRVSIYAFDSANQGYISVTFSRGRLTLKQNVGVQ